MKAPSLLKLGACLIYEALVLIALLFACASVFMMLVGSDATHGIKQAFFYLHLWISIGVYFVWCWHKSGQTLAMQTWQLKVLNLDSTLLSVNKAIARYVLACISLILFGLGFVWAIVDRDKLFLHDRLLKTHIIYVPRNTTL
jgi:uncharacterized RDD family membrane protein YckC